MLLSNSTMIWSYTRDSHFYIDCAAPAGKKKGFPYFLLIFMKRISVSSLLCRAVLIPQYCHVSGENRQVTTLALLMFKKAICLKGRDRRRRKWTSQIKNCTAVSLQAIYQSYSTIQLIHYSYKRNPCISRYNPCQISGHNHRLLGLQVR